MAKLADPFYSNAVKENREDIDKCDGHLLDYLQTRVMFAASFIKKHGCGLITKDDISEYIDIVIKITKRAEEREIAELENENESSRTAKTH